MKQKSLQLYVLGFLFSPGDDRVVLIRKNRPHWAKGKWNGVGGRRGNDESSREAMAREFREEAGLWVPPDQWREFGSMMGRDWIVALFEAQLTGLEEAKTVTDEEIRVWSMNHAELRYPKTDLAFDDLPLVPSVKWLVWLAQDRNKAYTKILTI